VQSLVEASRTDLQIAWPHECTVRVCNQNRSFKIKFDLGTIKNSPYLTHLAGYSTSCSSFLVFTLRSLRVFFDGGSYDGDSRLKLSRAESTSLAQNVWGAKT